ncbi:MAG TPA: hypothetical protein PK198_14200, partial [Saprospiraceae bacterium]|nr:hypothetical protein [Saprospiraceae bacterium]
MIYNTLSVPGMFPVCSRSKRKLLIFSIVKFSLCSRCVPGFDLFLKSEKITTTRNCEKYRPNNFLQQRGRFEVADLQNVPNSRQRPGTKCPIPGTHREQ